MLLSILPKAFVDATVGPLVHSITVLLVIDVLAFELLFIAPNIFAATMHFSILPLSYVVPSVLPLDYPVAIYLVVFPLTEVARPIWPHVCSHSLLLAILVTTEIL